MTAVRPLPGQRPWALLLVAVCLVAVNLRMTITGVGPLLDQIAEDQGVSPAALGALGSVPLIAWAVFSPLSHWLSARIGMSQAVSWSLLVLAAGTVWRSTPGAPLNLWAGTVLIGAGLAVSNVLIPAVIKHEFAARLPLVMGVYTALLSGAGSLGAGLVVPISEAEVSGEALGWRVALLATGVTIPFALGVWIWATGGARSASRDVAAASDGEDRRGATGARPAAEPEGDRDAGRRIWGDGLAWLVAGYMGTQSLIFYVLATWLAPYLQSLGQSPTAAGIGVMVFQLFGLVGSMLVPLFARGGLRRWLAMILPLFGLFSWVGMIAAPAGMPLWILIAGLVAGAQLTLSITLMALRARTRAIATALSGMAQSVGYLIAAAGPMLFGYLHGLSDGWVLPFALIWAAAGAQIIIGVLVGRPRFVLEPR